MKLSKTNPIYRALAIAALACATSQVLHAQSASANSVNIGGTPAPVQAVDDPYNLPSPGPVMAGGSTPASASFDQNVLPALQKFIAQDLPDGQNNLNAPIFQIDPNKLVLASATSVTATFINDGGAYDSAVGVDALAPGQGEPANWWEEVTSPTASLVFANAGSTDSSWPSGTPGVRNTSQPVLPGDFVNMGTYAAGTKLDFFLMANGANQAWAPVFSANESLNEDGFNQHVAAFNVSVLGLPTMNSPYIFLAFKDMWGGGDRDMNDVIIALNVGAANVKSLLATPEPAMPLTFTACLGLALFAVRKNQKKNQTNKTVA